MERVRGGFVSGRGGDGSGRCNYFVGGLGTYNTELKVQMGVPLEILEQYGAISEEAARAMAHTVRKRFDTDFGLGITGVAGPDEEEDKPVGTAHIAIEGPEGVVTGMGPGWRASRDDNKRFAVLAALNLLRLHLEGVIKGK